ncbi:helix-turn-helix transcriptional regulator [Nocardiopsis sp. NPDC049922]|uniref:helix-turn-helix domain-containing protein n=1 Tax=Nocardiopsis sp. NPDC049922 TaxID=3155157 RepID=UPI0033F8F01D
MANGVDPAARKFGAEVRRQREHAGLSQTKLANLIPASQASISDLELGKTRCKKGMAERIDAVLNSEGRIIATWEVQYDVYEAPEWYRKLPALEPRATEIQQYHPLLVPGLLQTRDYMRASIRAGSRTMSQAAVDAKIKERTERQELLKRDDPPFFSVVLDETVMYRRLGSTDTMREQLEHLERVSTESHVQIQIIPADTWDHPGLDHAFMLLKVPDAGTFLYLETGSFGGVLVERQIIDEHISRMGDLRGFALPPDQSRALIRKAQGEVE